MGEISTLLNDEIVAEIQNLSEMEDGSEEKSQAIDNLVKLHRLRIEEIECELDADEIVKRRQMEHEQRNEQVKERHFKVRVAAAELIVPLIFYGIWMRKGFKFEETGTYTSNTFKGLINRFRQTKLKFIKEGVCFAHPLLFTQFIHRLLWNSRKGGKLK